MAPVPTLGKLLKLARVSAGLEQSEVGAALGVHRVTVSKWETDALRPSHDRVVELAELYRAPLQPLLDALVDATSGAGEVSRETLHDFAPNPRYRSEIPGRAYAVGLGYLERLQRAGVGREELEDAERLLFDSRYAKLNKRDRGELSEEDHILLIEAGWDIIREVLAWQGIRP